MLPPTRLPRYLAVMAHQHPGLTERVAGVLNRPRTPRWLSLHGL